MMCKGGKCGGFHMVALVLTVIGGINWGLIGLGGFMNADWNVVKMLLGAWPQVEWVVYILVGLSAIAMLAKCGMGGSCKGGECKAGSCNGQK